MGVLNKFMHFLGIQDEQASHSQSAQGKEEGDLYDDSTPIFENRKNHKGNKVVSIHAHKNVKVVLQEPCSYDEVQQISNHLRSHNSVVVNLQKVDENQALRIIDFLSGTVYALNGDMSRIGDSIFLCTPDTVEIQGTITGVLIPK